MAVDYWKKLNQKPAICKAKNMTYTRSTKVLYLSDYGSKKEKKHSMNLAGAAIIYMGFELR